MPRQLVGYDPFEDYDRADVGAMDLVGDDDLDELLDLVGNDDESYGAEELDEWIEGDDDDDDEDDDEVGRRRRRRRRGRSPTRSRRAALAKLIARKRRRGLVAAQSRTSAGRQIFFGGEGTQGAVAGVLTMSTKVQELCRVTRLYISADDGAGNILPSASYKILDVKVGVKSQFTALVGIPGVLFDSQNTAQFTGFEMDTTQPGTDFSVLIQNAPALSNFSYAAVAKALR